MTTEQQTISYAAVAISTKERVQIKKNGVKEEEGGRKFIYFLLRSVMEKKKDKERKGTLSTMAHKQSKRKRRSVLREKEMYFSREACHVDDVMTKFNR